jgi:multidrug efflux pump
MSDVARVEMGSEDYTATANLNGHPAAGMAVMLPRVPTRWTPRRR